MDETIVLKYPVQHNDIKFESVTMRRPKVRDLVKVQSPGVSPAEQEVNLISILTDINPDDLMEIDGGDYGKIQKVLTGFLS